jgi:hypothetical protein
MSAIVDDLGDHAARKAERAVLPVMKLCDNDKDAFIVGTYATAACLGLAAAAYSTHTGKSKSECLREALEAVRSIVERVP